MARTWFKRPFLFFFLLSFTLCFDCTLASGAKQILLPCFVALSRWAKDWHATSNVFAGQFFIDEDTDKDNSNKDEEFNQVLSPRRGIVISALGDATLIFSLFAA